MRASLSEAITGMKEIHRHLAAALLVGLGYWVLEKFSLSLAMIAGGISYIWPANGLVLGALMCTRPRFWPWYLLTVFVVSALTINASPMQSVLYALFNAVEPLLVAWMVVAMLGVRPRIDSVRRIMVVVLAIAGVVALATLFASFVRSLSFPIEFMHFWTVWYVSDVLGMLIVGLLIACISGEWRSHWDHLSGTRLWEATALLAGLVAMTHVCFAVLPQLKSSFLDVFSTPFMGPAVFLIWGGIRFGLSGAAVSIAVLALQTYWYTAYGVGPIAAKYSDTAATMVHLQALLALMDLLVLTIAAVSAERRKAYLEGDAAHKRLEFAIQANDMLVFEADPATRKILWSGDTMAVMGKPARDLSNIDELTPLIHDEDRAPVMKQYAELTSGARASANFDYRLRFDGGDWMSLGVSAYAVPLKDSGFAAKSHAVRVIGFVKNVTEKRRLEEEKRLLEERLRQSEKMEAIGGLAGGIAHDFNNILGAILGYAEMAQTELPPGSEIRRYVDTIASAGERGKALVSQILTFSRVNRADVRPIEMKMLVEEVMAVLRGSMPANVRICGSVADGPLLVLGNATHLYQLVMNLAGNAIQAMPAGGDLKLSLGMIDNAQETVLQGGVLSCGRFVMLDIEDQGVGIGADVLPRIFEPFFSTKSREKGTGLGLAIVHGVVLSHGGAIGVQSVPGKGSKFTAYLPEYAGPDTGATRAKGDHARGRGQSILVVDDEPAMVALAEDFLAQLGYEPLGFTSSREALTAYLSEPGRFDAVMTDEVMPEMTGTELSARLHKVNASLPILVVSGFGGKDFESRVTAAGVSLVLKKPYHKAELAAAMATMLTIQNQ